MLIPVIKALGECKLGNRYATKTPIQLCSKAHYSSAYLTVFPPWKQVFIATFSPEISNCSILFCFQLLCWIFASWVLSWVTRKANWQYRYMLHPPANSSDTRGGGNHSSVNMNVKAEFYVLMPLYFVLDGFIEKAPRFLFYNKISRLAT